MKFRALIFLIVLVAAGCSRGQLLHVGNQTLRVEIANTDAAREQGLSGRSKLADNQGMLFDFRNTDNHQPAFWMKDMKFNLDLIWIDSGSVTGITTNVPAPKNATDPLPTYRPPDKADMVLEVNANWGKAHNIKVGDKVSF